MHYVYLIRSKISPDQTYIGDTDDLKARIKARNNGQGGTTAKSKPWKLETYLAFSGKKQALDFEAYLKSGSGHAFARKRLWS
ncbi:MAG: GIY-YIG nuclease family protein [Verrucomicrobiota bacterium]